MEEDIKNMSKEELLEYLEDISQQLDNIALDQIQFAISELQFFKEEYKKLEEENKILQAFGDFFMKNDFIPISVIQNKIKELEQIKSTALTFRTVEMMNDKIQILELLLEERKE